MQKTAPKVNELYLGPRPTLCVSFAEIPLVVCVQSCSQTNHQKNKHVKIYPPW